jgi:hypothetical protein
MNREATMNQNDIELLQREVLDGVYIFGEFHPDIDINHALMLVESEWFRKRYLVSIIQFPELETQWLVQIENKKWDGNNELTLVEVRNDKLETAMSEAVLEVVKGER